MTGIDLTLLLAAAVAAGAAAWTHRLFRGRVLTRPAARLLRWPLTFVRGVTLRFLMAVLGEAALVALFHSLAPAHAWLLALYLDDFLTGEDDKWRRFKGWSGNKIKWLMDLPAPPVTG